MKVFINCPFSPDYSDNLWAIVFTVERLGLVPRCALEDEDSSKNRFEKICRLIEQCDIAIHDISKTALDPDSGLPRFNMPLELGIFLGAKRFGNRLQKAKVCLIMDSHKYRFQQFISDIAGNDIHAHENRTDKLVEVLTSWFRTQFRDRKFPYGRKVYEEYMAFKRALPLLCATQNIEVDEMNYNDFVILSSEWIAANS